MSTSVRTFFALVIGCVALVGCEEGTTALGDPTVSLFLTDAPGDVEAVWVEILEIYLQGQGGREYLLDEPTELIELTELSASTLPIVEGVEVPAGHYSQVRFVIGRAVLETIDGKVFTTNGAEHPEGLESTGILTCPSCAQSGLKVKLPGGGLELGEDGYVMLADFDVSQSFGKEAGSSGKWVMHPVIHASALTSGGGITGTVELADGVLVPECPAATAQDVAAFIPTATTQTLLDGESMPITRSGLTKPDGTFAINYLAPDGYDLGYVADVEILDHKLLFTAGVVPSMATVDAGGTVDGVVYTITAAVCEAPA